MKKNRGQQAIVFLMGWLLLLMLFPLAGQAAQKGQVVYATSYDIFYQKGGDPATHSGGTGPLICHHGF